MAKKLWALLLAVAMLAGTMTIFAEEEKTVSAEKLNLLQVLGVIDTVPEDVTAGVKRSQFAVYVKNLMQYQDAVGSTQYFHDVKADDPAYAAVQTLASNNVVCGYATRVFAPERIIAGGEAVRMIMSALGYDPMLQNENNISGYMRLANQYGLLRKVAIGQSQEMDFVDCCDLLFAALDTKQCKMSYDGDKVTYTEGDENLLAAVYEVYEGKGTLETIGRKSFAYQQTAAANYLMIDGAEYAAADAMQFDKYFGSKVVFYYRAAEDDDEKEVLYMGYDKNVKVITIDAENFISCINGRITYEDANRSRSITLSDYVNVLKNGVLAETVTDEMFAITEGVITLICNDGSKCDNVIIEETQSAVLNNVFDNTDNYQLMFRFTKNRIKLEKDNVNKQYEILDAYDAPMALADLAGIAANTVLTVTADKTTEGAFGVADDAEYVKIRVGQGTVEGTLESINDKYFRVDGTEYEFAATVDSDTTIAVGEGIALYLDYKGDVAGYEKASVGVSETRTQYGYLIRVYFTENEENHAYYKILNEVGEVKRYETAASYKINGTRIKENTTAEEMLIESAIYNRYSDIAAYNNAVSKGTYDATYMSQAIRFSVNAEGKLNKIETIQAFTGAAAGKAKDSFQINMQTTNVERKENNVFVDTAGAGKILSRVGPETITFYVPDTYQGTDEDAYQAVTVNTTTWPLYGKKDVVLFDVDDANVPGLLIAYGKSSGDTIQEQFMIEKIEEVLDEDNMEALQITGYAFTGQFTYTVRNQYRAKFEKLKCGDVINLVGGENDPQDYTMLLSIDTVTGTDKVTGLKDRYTTENLYAVAGVSPEIISFGEVYAISNRFLWVQSGPRSTAGSYKRDNGWGSYWANTSAIMDLAVIYDASGRRPVVTMASPEDIVTVMNNPSEATLVATFTSYGDTHGLAFYIGLE